MLAPGSKGWIDKYFDLVKSGQIRIDKNRPKDFSKLHFLHLTLGNSGIIFGFPLELIFAKDLDDSNWTSEEKLKLLLFESHLLIYQRTYKEVPFSKEEFIHSLLSFYRSHNARSITKLFGLLSKSSEVDTLENVLANRVDLKVNLIENKWWVNSLSNAFTYLDVILYYDFIHKKQEEALKKYSSFARNALVAITISAYSDGIVQDKEKDIFNVFLASANLEEDLRNEVRQKFRDGATFDDFSGYVRKNWLLKRFLLDVSVLTIFANHEPQENETAYLKRLADYLNIPQEEIDETLWMVENFLVKSKDRAVFLRDTSSYEKVYSSLSKRWVKVLMRNKDRLAEELKESRQLVMLVKKSATEELSKEERDMVKEQFKDIVKSVPALAIFMLPGGTILLPILLKVLPDLVPSAFRENRIEENGDQENKGAPPTK